MQRDENILSMLAIRSGESSDGTLAVESIIAAVGVVLVIATRTNWAFAMPFVALGAYSSWGLIEHFARRNILRMSREVRAILRRAQKSIAAIGVIAAMAVVFVVFGQILGVFVS